MVKSGRISVDKIQPFLPVYMYRGTTLTFSPIIVWVRLIQPQPPSLYTTGGPMATVAEESVAEESVAEPTLQQYVIVPPLSKASRKQKTNNLED